MVQHSVFVGIDVSKTHLDIHLHPSGQHWRCGTGSGELDALATRLAGLEPRAVGLEASGGYEARLADRLHAAGLDVHILPPGRIRGFARSIGQFAKTDRIDAGVIARYLQAMCDDLVPYRPDPIRQRLHALTAHRRRILAERGGLAGQLDTVQEPLVRSLIEERLAGIVQEIKRLETAIARLVAEDRSLQQRQARLRQVPGVGPVLAMPLLADMPELGRVSAKVAAALVGVAPYARQSGSSDRRGHCAGGRKHLRDIAYMAVLSAIKVNDPVLGGFYQRLRARGKPFKLAMIATVRKLITILNAIAKSDKAFA